MPNRVGIDIPKIEIRFEQLSVEGDAFVGSRALPTLLNSTMNSIEVAFYSRVLYMSLLSVLNVG